MNHYRARRVMRMRGIDEDVARRDVGVGGDLLRNAVQPRAGCFPAFRMDCFHRQDIERDQKDGRRTVRDCERACSKWIRVFARGIDYSEVASKHLSGEVVGDGLAAYTYTERDLSFTRE